MHRIAPRPGRAIALVAGAILLAGTVALPARAATGYADTWDWRQFQPEQSQVMQREKQAGIAYSPSQRERQIQRINRELAQESPTVRATMAHPPHEK